jgi:hypothetical protein
MSARNRAELAASYLLARDNDRPESDVYRRWLLGWPDWYRDSVASAPRAGEQALKTIAMVLVRAGVHARREGQWHDARAIARALNALLTINPPDADDDSDPFDAGTCAGIGPQAQGEAP